jgi:hypothetical protein
VAQTLAALAAMQHKLQGTIGDVRGAVLAIENASGEIAIGHQRPVHPHRAECQPTCSRPPARWSS